MKSEEIHVVRVALELGQALVRCRSVYVEEIVASVNEASSQAELGSVRSERDALNPILLDDLDPDFPSLRSVRGQPPNAGCRFIHPNYESLAVGAQSDPIYFPMAGGEVTGRHTTQAFTP